MEHTLGTTGPSAWTAVGGGVGGGWSAAKPSASGWIWVALALLFAAWWWSAAPAPGGGFFGNGFFGRALEGFAVGSATFAPQQAATARQAWTAASVRSSDSLLLAKYYNDYDAQLVAMDESLAWRMLQVALAAPAPKAGQQDRETDADAKAPDWVQHLAQLQAARRALKDCAHFMDEQHARLAATTGK